MSYARLRACAVCWYCFLQRTALRVLGWNPTNAITGQDGLKIVGESIGSENSEQYGPVS